MNCPISFYIAYVLGVNPHSRLGSRKWFYSSGVLVMLYIISVAISLLHVSITLRLNSVAFLTVIYRTFVSTYFISVGLQDIEETVNFYEVVISIFKDCSKWKTFRIWDITCFVLFMFIFAEMVVMFGDNIGMNVYFIMGASLNTFIPLVSMMMFAVCCSSVQALYTNLQNDILNTSPRSAGYKICKLKGRHLDIIDHIKDISNVFGVRLLLYTLMVQLVLLEKIDVLVHKAASNIFNAEFWFFIYSFCGYLGSLWYFSYEPWKAAEKHSEALATLMDLETRALDDQALHEIASLAEELQFRPSVFSAAGCFTMGFHIFFSVIGIVFSYVMIVGPIAYNKWKSQ